MSSNKMQQLRLTQQNLQNVMLQKQQIQGQLIELESALTELKTTEKAYKIVGKIMIVSSKEKLTKELQEKKEVQEVRLKNFNRQEEKLQAVLEQLQTDAVEDMKKNKQS